MKRHYVLILFGLLLVWGCGDAKDSTEELTEDNAKLCDDGEDNDEDGDVDCDDKDCAAVDVCSASKMDLGQFVEDPGAECEVLSPEWDQDAFDELEAIETLPDPFTMLNGEKVTTQSEWVCRRAEISSMLQRYELGEKPKKPKTVTGEMSGDTLTIFVSDGEENELSFNVTITYPSTGSAPYPALIGLAGGSLPQELFLDNGVAIINYNHDAMGDQGGKQKGIRGNGQFFDFYEDSDAGALLAWAWGASRIIDALEMTPEAEIDPTHLAVNGCSRNGKGALMIGALDNRIALTIPQESGSGGVASWRVSEEDDETLNVQTLRSACTEQPWFRQKLCVFSSNVNNLPIDHHEVMGMVAPRGLLVIGNVSMEWLGHNSCNQAVGAARLIYKALGAEENLGHTESSHEHCVFPSREEAALKAFIEKFLLDKDVDTDFWTVTNDLEDRWIDWDVPTLE